MDVWELLTTIFGFVAVVMTWVTRCVCYREGLYEEDSPIWLYAVLAITLFGFLISLACRIISLKNGGV